MKLAADALFMNDNAICQQNLCCLLKSQSILSDVPRSTLIEEMAIKTPFHWFRLFSDEKSNEYIRGKAKP